ncbi:MAG TPA: hypothetical protein PLX83_00980 [bacterium]|nr:hypothetical protein [bacterium]
MPIITDAVSSCPTPNPGPWTSTGRLVSRHPAGTGILLGVFFWIYRSQYYSGDGDQLTRMVEGGIWMVQTELASHAVFQFAYQLLRPWGWDGLSTINLVSCVAGAVSILVLLKFHEAYVGGNPLWTLALFGSSGLILYCNGHTEYYTLFLATLFYYGYAAVGYLRDRFSSLRAAVAFSVSAWMHLGILFAFPSLLILPLLKRRGSDYSGIASGLSLLVAAYYVKISGQILGVPIQGLSPSENFIPLHEDPSGERFYTLFDWGHLADFLYGWTMRSWLFWPLVIWAVWRSGPRSLFRPDRLFLLVYTLSFTVFTLTWHPNLGIHQDWDLFAIEAAPCLLLLLTYLPDLLASRFRRTLITVPVTASILIMYSHFLSEAYFDQRGYGQVVIQPSLDVECHVNLNGHLKQLTNPAVREGNYLAKVIDIDHARPYNFEVVAVPHTITFVPLRIIEKSRAIPGPSSD